MRKHFYIAVLSLASVLLPPRIYVQLFVRVIRKIQSGDQILDASQSQ